ncbi:MAG: elongation factor Ts [Ruminobacter sp.]|jgi:elongation factor Ts|nr:elongation factor Ts [Ruminobacter sp.]
MANITAALVKELRERTGAGMMDCKKALVAADGDIEKAIDDMRKNGQAKAAKKAGRVTAEGVIVSATSASGVYIAEINCETDFVAKDASFNEFCNTVVKIAAENNTTDVATIKALPYGNGETVEVYLNNLIAKIGENMSIRRFASIQASNVGLYIHNNKRIGVLVAMDGGDQALSNNIAMHVCGLAPQYVNPSDVPAEQVEREHQVQLELAMKENAEAAKPKPAEIVEKIINGRMAKYTGEVSLVTQNYVMDDSITVGDLLKKNGAVVKSFIRMVVGEGIEKQTVDFATEVAQQVAAAKK